MLQIKMLGLRTECVHLRYFDAVKHGKQAAIKMQRRVFYRPCGKKCRKPDILFEFCLY